MQKRTNSSLTDVVRVIPKTENDLNTSSDAAIRAPTTSGPVVSFADFLADTGDDDDDIVSQVISTSIKKISSST
jgi:hypothetical protein